MADLEKLVARLEVESAKWTRELGKARGQLGAFQRSSEASMAGIRKAFLTLGGTTAFVAFAKRTVDAGDRLDELKQKTGVAVEALSRLGFAAGFSGVDIETLSDAMGKNAKFVAELEKGSETAKAALDAIGVSTREYLALSEEERVLRAADAFREHADGSGKAAVAMQMYGKSGANLIPFLNEGTEGIRKLTEKADALAVTMSEEDARAMADFSDAAQTLAVAFSASLRPAIIALIGPLTSMAEVMAEDAKLAKSSNDDWSDLAETIKGLATAALSAWTGLQLLGTYAGGTAAAGFKFVTEGPEAGADAWGRMFDMITENLLRSSKRWDAIWSDSALGKNGMVKNLGALDPYSDTTFEGDAPLKKKPITFGSEDTAASLKAIDSQIAALERQVATLGMTNAQMEVYDLKLAGATQAQLAHADALARTIALYDEKQTTLQDLGEEEERINALFREYDTVITGVSEKEHAFNDAQEDLNQLLAAKVISADQYAAALGRVKDRIDGIKTAADLWEENFNRIEGAAKNLFSSMITDGKNWKDHLLSFASQIADSFADMAADILVQMIKIQLAKAIGSAVGGAVSGASGPGLLPVTDARFADGGIMQPNTLSLVGERGPELVVSSRAMRVFNAQDTDEILAQRGGGNVYMNITTPDAESFHRSGRQIRRDWQREVDRR